MVLQLTGVLIVLRCRVSTEYHSFALRVGSGFCVAHCCRRSCRPFFVFSSLKKYCGKSKHTGQKRWLWPAIHAAWHPNNEPVERARVGTVAETKEKLPLISGWRKQSLVEPRKPCRRLKVQEEDLKTTLLADGPSGRQLIDVVLRHKNEIVSRSSRSLPTGSVLLKHHRGPGDPSPFARPSLDLDQGEPSDRRFSADCPFSQNKVDCCS